MARYALRAFGAPVLVGPPPTVVIPPTNVVVYARGGNVTVKVRGGDK